MINFVDPLLEKYERKIIERTLECAVQTIRDTNSVAACIDTAFSLQLFKDYSREDFLGVLEHLLEMHNDEEAVYFVSEYHFLILHGILSWAIEQHNASVLQGADPWLLDSSRTINFDTLVDNLFHDLHFLMTGNEYNDLSTDEKEALGLSPELFGLANGFPPHPTEMEVHKEKAKKKNGKYQDWL